MDIEVRDTTSLSFFSGPDETFNTLAEAFEWILKEIEEDPDGRRFEISSNKMGFMHVDARDWTGLNDDDEEEEDEEEENSQLPLPEGRGF